jgi:hypothetical protein
METVAQYLQEFGLSDKEAKVKRNQEQDTAIGREETVDSKRMGRNFSTPGRAVD